MEESPVADVINRTRAVCALRKFDSGSAISYKKQLNMATQFGLCGPGIQSNRLKLPAQRPFIFAVWKDHHKIDRDLNAAVNILSAGLAFRACGDSRLTEATLR